MSDEEFEGDALDQFEADLIDVDDGRPRCRFCGQPLYGFTSVESGECDACTRVGAAIEAARRLPVPWYEREPQR